MALVDNDIIKKIALLNLVEAFEKLPECANGVLLLPTAKFALGSKSSAVKGARKHHGEAAANRIVEYTSTATTYPKDISVLSSLAGIEDIDAGEAGLFSAAVAMTDQLVLTGDKRAIGALASAPSHCQEAVVALEGRVLCFEQVIWLVMRQVGFAELYRRCGENLSCDKGLKAIFGTEPEDTHVTRGLSSYINHLRSVSGSLLHSCGP